MFGYRLLRDREHDRLLDERRSAEAGRDVALRDAAAATRELYERIVTLTGERDASRSLVDVLTVRLNVAEQELATMRNKITGLPTVAPQLAKGSPLMSERLGAGADLFEDVGEEAAKDLRARGLLHEEPEPIDMPSAAALTETHGVN